MVPEVTRRSLVSAPDYQIVVGDRRRAAVRLYLGTTAVHLDFRPEDRSRPPDMVVLSFGTEPVMLGAPEGARRWTMVEGLPPSWSARSDPFVWLMGRAGRNAWSPDELDERATVTARMRATARTEAKRLRAFVRQAARECVRRCDPTARTAGLCFVPCVRWWLYEQLVRDGTGRIAQLTASSPGTALFAFALCESPAFAEIGGALLADVVAGRKLDRALDDALERWVDASPAFAATQGIYAGEVWARLFNASPARRREMLRAQRLLIRRAMPRTAPTHVLLPPPLAFAPEDIPRKVRANARWFRAMKGCGATLSVRPGQDPEVGRAVARFVSAHALSLRVDPRKREPAIVRSIAEFCHARGRVPSRRTTPARLIPEALAWSETLENLGRITNEQRTGTGLEAMLAVPLPSETSLEWTSPQLQVRTFATVGALLDESKRMHNCMDRLVASAMASSSVYLHAGIDGTPHALELRTVGPGKMLVQLKGIANRSPTAAAVRTLDPWLRRHEIRLAPWLKPEALSQEQQAEIPF